MNCLTDSRPSSAGDMRETTERQDATLSLLAAEYWIILSSGLVQLVDHTCFNSYKNNIK